MNSLIKKALPLFSVTNGLKSHSKPYATAIAITVVFK